MKYFFAGILPRPFAILYNMHSFASFLRSNSMRQLWPLPGGKQLPNPTLTGRLKLPEGHGLYQLTRNIFGSYVTLVRQTPA